MGKDVSPGDWLRSALRLAVSVGAWWRKRRRPRRRSAGPNNPVTGLPGLDAFENTLAQAVKKADATSATLALLYVDIDDFKTVNSACGRREGDQVLRQVADRMRTLVRPFMAARLAGDRFLLLMNDGPQTAHASVLAAQVQAAMAEPFTVERGLVPTLTCSIGVAMYPEHGALSTMIAHAQAAMSAAKSAGGADHAFFDLSIARDRHHHAELVRDLRCAVERNQLQLYYQPKIHAPTGEITGAEALLRWSHPTRGMVGPAEFIPVAERCGLIVPIGLWVIDEACRQARVWRDKGIRMRVAINLSVHQLRDANLAGQIANALQKNQINPDLLTCEVTETSAMEDVDTTVRVLRQLDALGVHLSIDDFGTGHSSLAYLRDLPADELKIDRSFVLDLETSEAARKVALAVINLAKALDLKVVAEGVETEEQNRILREFGCDQLQGFLFAKPMSAAALTQWAMDNVGPRAMNFRASLFTNTTFAPLRPQETSEYNAVR